MTSTHLSILLASLDEVASNGKFVESCAAFLPHASHTIYQHAEDNRLKGQLQEILSLRRSGNEASFRGLLVQAVGAFEVFVQEWCRIQFLRIEDNFNENPLSINDNFRNALFWQRLEVFFNVGKPGLSGVRDSIFHI